MVIFQVQRDNGHVFCDVQGRASQVRQSRSVVGGIRSETQRSQASAKCLLGHALDAIVAPGYSSSCSSRVPRSLDSGHRGDSTLSRNLPPKTES